MAFRSIKEVGDAEVSGAVVFSTMRKTPSGSATVTVWQDLAMSPGHPNPIYYASTPLESVAMSHSTHGGIYHGGNVSPKKKILKTSMLMMNTASWQGVPFILCDYLMYYPFIDESDSTDQMLINTATLPRYIDGNGVMIMPVSVGPRTGGQTYRISYTNELGVSGRLTSICFENSSAVNGSVQCNLNQTLNRTSLPFVPLQAGDKGVRSIEAFTMVSGVDTGLLTLVLVKPLATTTLLELAAAVEVDYVTNRGLSPPVIEDGASLNFICGSNQSFTGVSLHGAFKFIFN